MMSPYSTAVPEKRPLVELGAHDAAHISDACQGELVITMLADDNAVSGIGWERGHH